LTSGGARESISTPLGVERARQAIIMIQAAAATLSKAASYALGQRSDSVPGPGPAQTLMFGIDVLRHGERAFDSLFEIYGDVVAISVPEAVPGVSRIVLFRDPALVQPVLNAPPGALSNDGNLPIVDLYGTRSLVLLDGPPHLRLRKLMLPAMRKEALEHWRTLITDMARREARALPIGEPVKLHPRLLKGGLEVILRIVVGVDGDLLATWVPPMTELLELAVSEEYSIRYVLRHTGAFKYWRRFHRVRGECNRLVYEEIARRRRNLEQRSHDLLDSLLHVDGEPLTDQEIRDQIITMLIAGHETSATALSWAIERLIRHPSALERATAEALAPSGGTDYAEAVMHETMRVRPTIAFYGRVTRQPFRLGRFELAPNTLIMPHLRGIHRNPSVYEAPDEFRPERFIEKKFGAYQFVPFGGGVHKCLGDRLALFQTTLILQTFLRELVLSPANVRGEPTRRKAIVYTPGHGATVIAHRRVPSAAPSV
jgi:cytochrome P450